MASEAGKSTGQIVIRGQYHRVQLNIPHILRQNLKGSIKSNLAKLQISKLREAKQASVPAQWASAVSFSWTMATRVFMMSQMSSAKSCRLV